MVRSMRRLFLLLSLLGLGALALGCGGQGAEGDGPAGAQKTGQVSVFVTDAPVDGLQAVNLTISKIELLGRETATLFEGEETFDLLALRDVSDLFASDDAVPAGLYWRVRLHVEAIEIVDDQGASHFPELPLTRQIDLLPRRPIHVAAGESVALEMDIDLRRSILSHRDGHYLFRPIVFVRVIDPDQPGRLVRLYGRMDDIDVDAGTFGLCYLRRPMLWHAILRRHVYGALSGYANSKGMEVLDPAAESSQLAASAPADLTGDHAFPRRCVQVHLGDASSLFADDGQPTTLDAFAEGDPATVFGRIALTGSGLQMRGGLVLAGTPGTYAGLRGFVASDVDAGLGFDFEIDPARHGLPAGTLLAAQLYPESKLFSRAGEVIDVDDVEVDQRARAVGVLVLDPLGEDVLRTALLIVAVGAVEDEPVRGEISAIDPGARQLTLTTDEAGATVERCVDVPDDANVFLVDALGGTSAEVDLEDLAVGDRADVYPLAGAAGPCLEAGTVIAFEEDDGAI